MQLNTNYQSQRCVANDRKTCCSIPDDKYTVHFAFFATFFFDSLPLVPPTDTKSRSALARRLHNVHRTQFKILHRARLQVQQSFDYFRLIE
jgi:hypothetical protein